MAQQQLRPPRHPVFQQVLDRGALDGLLKAAQALPLPDVGRPRDVRQGELPGVVLMDVLQHSPHAQVVQALPRPGAVHLRLKRLNQLKGEAGQAVPHQKLIAVRLALHRLEGPAEAVRRLPLSLLREEKAGEGGTADQRVYVPPGKYGVLAAGEQGRVEHQRAQLAEVRGPPGVEHIGVDRKEIARPEQDGLRRRPPLQRTLLYIEELQLLVPVPWNPVPLLSGVAGGVPRAGKLQRPVGLKLLQPPVQIQPALLKRHAAHPRSPPNLAVFLYYKSKIELIQGRFVGMM